MVRTNPRGKSPIQFLCVASKSLVRCKSMEGEGRKGRENGEERDDTPGGGQRMNCKALGYLQHCSH